MFTSLQTILVAITMLVTFKFKMTLPIGVFSFRWRLKKENGNIFLLSLVISFTTRIVQFTLRSINLKNEINIIQCIIKCKTVCINFTLKIWTKLNVKRKAFYGIKWYQNSTWKPIFGDKNYINNVLWLHYRILNAGNSQYYSDNWICLSIRCC